MKYLPLYEVSNKCSKIGSMFKLPEQHRKDNPLLPLNPGDQGAGYFKIPYKAGSYFLCVATSGEDWEHVAVIVAAAFKTTDRCPSWDEMCFIKSVFWDEEDPAIQIHPPKSQWVNNHPFALHLWRPKKAIIPMPPTEMVGIL